jgi:hypothetical protein
MKHSRFPRGQHMTIVGGILSVVAITVVVQLWLFTTTIGAYLGGDATILPAAALASLACLLLNAGLLRYLSILEREPAVARDADSPYTRGRAPAFRAERVNTSGRAMSAASPRGSRRVPPQVEHGR